MNRVQYVQRGGLLTGVGSFLAGVPSVMPIPAPPIVGDTLASLGVGIGVWGLSMIAIPWLPQWSEDFPYVRPVRRSDLKQTYSFCNGFFGDGFSSYNSVKRWFAHNDGMFWIVEKTRRKGAVTIRSITGFYSILPLTANGVSKLLEGQVEGTSFTTDHIQTDFESPAAYYIGAIASKGGKSKGVALGALIGCMSEYLRKNPAPVYTRPTTRDGLRLARERGFESVDGSGTVDIKKLYVREPDESF